MTRPVATWLTLALIGFGATLASSATVTYNWVVSYKFIKPDCVEKVSPVVNGAYPGPTIDVTEGDTVVVVVTNALPTENTILHWHGIEQKGTPYSDGTAETQCPIGPGQNYTYSFTVDRPGTYWWHSHDGLQKGSLYGALIVRSKEPEPFSVDGEHIMLLNDWWHASQIDQIAGLLSIPFRWVGNPQSLLINGKGIFSNCNVDPTCNSSSTDCGYSVFQVESGKVYRIRAIGSGSLVMMNLRIQNHVLTVVETDGDYIVPKTFPSADINNGESYSFLVKADQPIGNYWIRTSIAYRTNDGSAIGRAILRYVGAPAALPRKSISPGVDNLMQSMRRARRIKSTTERAVPRTSSRQFILLGTQNFYRGYLRWSVNNISNAAPDTPALLSNAFGTLAQDRSPIIEQLTPPTVFDYNLTLQAAGLSTEAERAYHLIKIDHGEVIEIVLQNTRALNGAAEYHPWHCA